MIIGGENDDKLQFLPSQRQDEPPLHP